MPIYEFVCDCGGSFEVRCPISTEAAVCPKCGAQAPRVYSSSFSIHVVPTYSEACEETDQMMRKGKISMGSPLIRQGLQEE